jgi:glycosyltransferase involved in cell wall biosynthesis
LFLPAVLRRAYDQADAVVAVSDGVADDLAAWSGLARGRITTIYNPVATPDLAALQRAPVDHPWFQPGAPPVVMSAGRLSRAKDFPTLIRAFARVRRALPARLVIFGQGKSEWKTTKSIAALRQLAAGLGIAADVALPGFVANPFAYMARAATFALSSINEGLPGVLIQAMACGCPVVSTDCPSGPAEILAAGRYGRLVPPGDDRALAEAIIATLEAPPPADVLRERAGFFSVERAVAQYERLMLGDAPFARPATAAEPSHAAI